jgi:hypothetical protein
MRPARICTVVGAALACATLPFFKTTSSALADPSALVVESVASPASGESSEPQLTTNGDRTLLSWIEIVDDRTTLKFVERTTLGWSAPQVVTSTTDFYVIPADVPSVRALSDGTLVADWPQQDADAEEEAYNVRLSWSKDGGRSWSKPSNPHHDGTKTQHGFASLFPAPEGVGVVWLDGRATNPKTSTGDMALRAALYDRSGTQLHEMLIDSRVCDCCSTDTAVTADGMIVAYRGRSADEVRDIYVSRYEAGRWGPPILVHNDGWRIEACPVNGPAISARDRTVGVAWFSAKGDQGHAFVAFSHDAGRTFGSPIRVDDQASAGRVGLALLPDGSAAMTWVEFANQRSEFRLRRVEPSGARSAAVTVGQSGSTRIPRVTLHRNELVFAWTEDNKGSSRVRTARATVPPIAPGGKP